MIVRLFISALALLMLALPNVAWAGGVMSFSNQSAAAGVSVSHSPTYGDSFLAGGAVGDFNDDGFQDIFFPRGGGGPDRLYINDGDGTFTDEASAWGIAATHQGTAAAVADFNGDGWVDLYVSSFNGNRLYRNDGGTGFTNIAAAAGVGLSSAPYGAAWGDYDLDGDLDLAVCSWSTSSTNRLYRNNGDETFTDVTGPAGLLSALSGIVGFTTKFVDMNGDLYPELLWVGDFGTSRYLINNGDGTFTNGTAAAGVAFDSTEMGHTVADFDRDGDFDWYVTTINSNNLYENVGVHDYDNIAGPAGVEFTGWGWGTVSGDFDHDLRVDLAATSQGGQYIMRNITSFPGGSLQFNYPVSGFSSGVSGRGLANFDYDNDGDQDLIVFPRSGALQLFRNDLSGPDTHWIRIWLEPGTSSDIPPHGVGSVITVTVGGVSLMGRVDAGNNYLSQSELSAHFGLGAATVIDELTVQWTNGATTTLTSVAVDQQLTITYAIAEFKRGDVNVDGASDIADPIYLLDSMFSSGPAPACESASDVNDDAMVNIADVVALLAGIFEGAAIADPYSNCGVDPTADSLGCDSFSACP